MSDWAFDWIKKNLIPYIGSLATCISDQTVFDQNDNLFVWSKRLAVSIN
jgi:hypothetical protein